MDHTHVVASQAFRISSWNWHSDLSSREFRISYPRTTLANAINPPEARWGYECLAIEKNALCNKISRRCKTELFGSTPHLTEYVCSYEFCFQNKERRRHKSPHFDTRDSVTESLSCIYRRWYERLKHHACRPFLYAHKETRGDTMAKLHTKQSCGVSHHLLLICFFCNPAYTSATLHASVLGETYATTPDTNGYSHVPMGTTSIGFGSYMGCTSLVNLSISPSVTTIEVGAFEACYNLVNISLPSSLLSIGEGAFIACRSLVSISIPPSVTFIGAGAFQQCTGLARIHIPSSNTFVTDGALPTCLGFGLLMTGMSMPRIVKSKGTLMRHLRLPGNVTVSMGDCDCDALCPKPYFILESLCRISFSTESVTHMLYTLLIYNLCLHTSRMFALSQDRAILAFLRKLFNEFHEWAPQVLYLIKSGCLVSILNSKSYIEYFRRRFSIRMAERIGVSSVSKTLPQLRIL